MPYMYSVPYMCIVLYCGLIKNLYRVFVEKNASNTLSVLVARGKEGLKVASEQRQRKTNVSPGSEFQVVGPAKANPGKWRD